LRADPSRLVDLRFGRPRGGRTPVLLIAVEAQPAVQQPAVQKAAAEPPAVEQPAASVPGAPPPASASREALADVSHEMRTPLNAVIGFADAMVSETYGPLGHPKYEEYAGIIRASGKHLLDLVNAALDLARVEAGRYVLKRETVDLGALARDCAALMRLEAEKAGLKIRLDIASDVPQAALDPRAIKQVLINLIANAVKFTSDGEVAITVRAEGGDLLLSVSDTGVGMTPAEIARLGERFASKGPDGVRGAGGAGLGLALAFSFVELHGGVLSLDSAPGEGLRAQARLPIVRPVRPIRRLKSADADRGEPAAARPAILSELERIEAFRRERALMSKKSAA
jgi:cell cycle sensor histidine kinase DivJ